MAAKQDHDDEDMDDITDDIDDGNDIDSLLESIETGRNNEVTSSLTARRRIEDLLEERRLKQQIEDYNDWD
jgi:hypothetical protein